MGFWDGSSISWIMCKQSAPRSRQTTTPTPQHSIFTGLMPNQQCQKHQRHIMTIITVMNINITRTQTDGTDETRLHDFHLKVVLGWSERLSRYVQANTAIFLTTVAAHNKCTLSVRRKLMPQSCGIINRVTTLPKM